MTQLGQINWDKCADWWLSKLTSHHNKVLSEILEEVDRFRETKYDSKDEYIIGTLDGRNEMLDKVYSLIQSKLLE